MAQRVCARHGLLLLPLGLALVGLVYVQTSEFDRAKAWIGRLPIGPNDHPNEAAIHRLVAGAMHAAKGDTVEASQSYREALALEGVAPVLRRLVSRRLKAVSSG